jgi:S-methylmethionine-dependent homocysteine/selenocysteine methylase
MTRSQTRLPQENGGIYLTDGGLETTLVFLEGFDLPYFAAFPLLKDFRGRLALRDYFERHARIAVERGVGFILDTATWRASLDWGEKIGYSREALAEVNRDAVALIKEVRDRHESDLSPMVINGVIGPRGDGYVAGEAMTPEEAEDYHAFQLRAFREASVDMISAITMTNAEEAVGIVRAAQAEELPVVISFTVETDGRLPSGQSLKDAIEQVDSTTGQGPAYFMINCAHPTHFWDLLDSKEAWIKRVKGVRANASKRSHEELDNAEDLDAGDPQELSREYREIRARQPQINVLGGCCGTDHRHIHAIGETCVQRAAAE